MSLEPGVPEEAPAQTDPQQPGVATLGLVRGYVLLILGCGLIVWSLIPPAKPGALTMGGALVGFNPLFRAAVSGGTGGHGG